MGSSTNDASSRATAALFIRSTLTRDQISETLWKLGTETLEFCKNETRESILPLDAARHEDGCQRRQRLFVPARARVPIGSKADLSVGGAWQRPNHLPEEERVCLSTSFSAGWRGCPAGSPPSPRRAACALVRRKEGILAPSNFRSDHEKVCFARARGSGPASCERRLGATPQDGLFEEGHCAAVRVGVHLGRRGEKSTDSSVSVSLSLRLRRPPREPSRVGDLSGRIRQRERERLGALDLKKTRSSALRGGRVRRRPRR